MSDLKITWSEGESCLRSIGAPPNGIIGFSLTAGEEQHVGFFCSPTWDPEKRPSLFGEASDVAADLEEIPLELDDVLAALADDEAARHLFGMAASTVIAATERYVPMCQFAVLHEALLELETVHNALVERFEASGE